MPKNLERPEPARPRRSRPLKTARPAARDAAIDGNERLAFPVVAIAATSVDAAALGELLNRASAEPAMAIVVVSQDSSALLPGAIATTGAFRLLTAMEGAAIAPGHVYLLPGDRTLVLKRGVFARADSRGASLPAVFASIARNAGRRAIGVILSGQADGAVDALRLVKEAGGASLVQRPSTAAFDAAPRAAVGSGLADHVLSPAQIGYELSRLALVQEDRDATPRLPMPMIDPAEGLAASPHYRRVLGLLKNRFQIDLSNYKPTTLQRRIERRMVIEGYASLETFAEFLQSTPDAVKGLHDELFIHVTQFFRDPEAFAVLRDQVFPVLLKNRPEDSPIRIWVPGCSTGEEAFSIAMHLTEFLEETSSTCQLQLFATDVSEAAIAQARRAEYATEVLENVSPARRDRFFERFDGGYKVTKRIRDLCVFSRHDVTANPPFARLDLVSCRNVLIYFGADLQKRILPIFHYALKADGFLWLGHSETPGASSKLFATVDKSNKIYSKVPLAPGQLLLTAGALFGQKLEFPRAVPPPSSKDASGHKSADELVLSRYGPAGAVVDGALDILQFRGQTAPYLSPPSGVPTRSLLRMAHADLRLPLRRLLRQAEKHAETVRQEHVPVDGRHVNLDVSVLNPLAPPAQREYLLIFEEERTEQSPSRGAARAKKKAARGGGSAQRLVDQLQLEVDALREHQHALVEQFDASQEELTSANEELQATNEEFQSTNEELETAKEELQAANEELTSLNDELHARNADLIAANEKLARGEDRFRLLVESVKDYAIYMLDPQGRITSWNEGARRLKGYEATEILGESYERFFPPDAIGSRAPEIELERARIDGRFECEGWRIRKDGTRFWANVVLSRMNDASGKLIGFSKVTRDLTERNKNEDALRKANEGLDARVRERTRDLEKALRAREVFLSIASHELKTPLTGLKLQLQMGLRSVRSGKAAGPEPLIETYERSLRQAQVLEELIEDLLDVSRIHTGHFNLDLADLDAAELLDEVLARFAPVLTQQGILITAKIDRPLNARWDRRRVGQLIANLLSNAAKYAPHTPLRITASAEGDRVRVVLKDHGPGIHLDKQAAIFDRFERGDAAPHVGGLGLGLFIARRIAEAHGGTLSVESRPGDGAKFTLELPREVPVSAVESSEAEP
jgi:two-component system, chemotaxis family, CheB/CheR fusion protein